MSTNVANLVWTATGGTTGRSFAARYADCINVKDWGATGDGVTDDRPAIQALIDYIQSNALAAGGQNYCKQAIYFPPGNYRCNTSTTGTAAQGVLVVNWGQTAALRNFCMFGDSSATTRIFYDGTILSGAGKNTILLAFDQRVDGPYLCGLHLDMTPATGGATQATADHGDPMCFWNRGRQGRAGSKGEYVDVKFTGSCFGMAHSGEGASQGAENVYLFCKFEDCLYGFCTFSANSLDHTLIGGYCKNCIGGGIVGVQGAICVVVGMEFLGNADHTVNNPVTGDGVGDISDQNAQPMFVAGCNSTSTDFILYANGSSYFLANYHHPSSSGIFGLVKSAPATLDANWSTDGVMQGNASNLYLRSNRFDNAGYLTTYSSSLVIENI